MTLIPKQLQPGDKVVVVSPAGIVKPQNIYGAMNVLRDHGWEAVAATHAFDRYDTFAGSDSERLDDMRNALLDPLTRAILCGRGGYGSVRLLEDLNRLDLCSDPKWLIGFSDITALHGLMASKGIVSIHSPMTSHMARTGGDDPDTRRLARMLEGHFADYRFDPHPFNRAGEATGRLLGGNLAVMAGLIGTPFDMIKPGAILFIEDIAEPVYKVERILYQLKLLRVLDRLGALIVGQFTDYTPGLGDRSAEQIIKRMVSDYSYPVVFNAPIGHVEHNVPLPVSLEMSLKVTAEGATLSPVV